MNKVLQADLQIFGAAFCFGIGFIGQRAVSIEGLGPMTCNAIRFSLSSIFLVVALPWIPSKYLALAHTEEGEEDESPEDQVQEDKRDCTNWYCFQRFFGPQTAVNKYYQEAKKTALFWGVFLGFINFFGSGLQQWGITMTSANKVAFIAGFDLFLTPVLALFIPTFKRNAKPTMTTWISVAIAMVGLFMLSDAEWDMEIGAGEKLTLISTLFWTLHITYTDIATQHINGIQMMIVQLIVVSVLSIIVAVATEPQGWMLSHIVLILPWILFVAIAEGIGFTLMALGQTYSPATHAALLLSLEGVFASVFSYMMLGETLTVHELCGAALMLAATYLAKMGFTCIPGSQNCGEDLLARMEAGTSSSTSNAQGTWAWNDLYHRARVWLASLSASPADKQKDTYDRGEEAAPLVEVVRANSSEGTVLAVPVKGRHHLNPNALLI